jgi:ATP-dependent RNA helicase RhlE
MRAEHLAARSSSPTTATPKEWKSATPGALLDLGFVESLVLDECDKMLELGFFPAVKQLYRLLPKPRKLLRGGTCVLVVLCAVRRC